MTIINYDYYPFLENWDHLGNSATLIWTGDPQTIADHPNVTNHKNLYPNTQIEYRYPIDTMTHRWHAPLHDSPNQYFYVEIYSGCAFEYFPFDGWTGSWFEKIKNNEVHLFIQINAHGPHDTIDSIYDNIIIKYGIDPQNITLSSESADMAGHLEIVCYQKNLPKINLQWNVQFEFLQAELAKQPMWFGNKANVLQHKVYERKFLSFNGFFRIHRGALIMLLSAKNLLDKGIVSYNSKGYFLDPHISAGQSVCDKVYASFIYNKEIVKLIADNREKLVEIDRIDFESQESDQYHPFDLTPNHRELYENTYFSIVTETSFPYHRVDNNYADATDIGRILSEKTFKAISMRHPFIMVSNPHTLKLLRDIGYKTFHPLIDETYDKVKDPGVRMMMIINEVEKLCELEGEDLTNFLTKAKEICDYNYEVLINKKLFWHPLHYIEGTTI